MEALERALAVHEAWLAAGRPVPAAELVAAHPELAEFLAALVADRGDVERAIGEADAGSRVLGDFRLLDEIGRGGMGVVYRARQLSLPREVAVKVLPDHLTRQASAVARFKREAALAARLAHPGIVEIYAVGSDGDVHWFAMELVDGAPVARLDPVLGRERSVRDVVELCAAVCDALQHAHAQGILHRDVKPSNVLVRRDGRPVLTDFGLARDVDDPGITRTGAFAGTPHYTAPEQIAGVGAVDARADVYALGATAYELLTGRRPFEGRSTAEVFARIATAEIADPLRLVPDLSPDLAAILLKALEKQPARRYATAAAFGADLRAFLEFRPVTARRATPWLRLQRWVRREPWRATMALVLLLLVPTLAAALGYLGAQRATIQVGSEELARQRHEAHLAGLAGDLEAGDYESAREQAALAIAEVPGDVEAHALAALVRVRTEPAAAAVAALDAAIATQALPHADRARVLLLTELGREPEAERLRAGLPPASEPAALFLDGMAATVRCQRAASSPAAWRDVRDTFLLAIVRSRAPRLLYYLKWANAVGWSGDRVGARACTETLLQHWPDAPAALLYVAFALKREDPARAAGLYQRVIDGGKDHPRLFTTLAECLRDAGDAAAAGAAMARGIAAYRERERAGRLRVAERLDMVLALERSGHRDEAVAKVRAIAAELPDNARAQALLGWELKEAGSDDAGAAAALTRAVELNPGDSFSLLQLGMVQLRQAQPAAAATTVRRALARAPDNAAAHNLLGNALIALQDWPAAVTANRRSVELAPKEPGYHMNLAIALSGAGDTAAARLECAAALALRPVYPRARMLGARLAFDAGDRATARTELRTGIDTVTTGIEAVGTLREMADTAKEIGDVDLRRLALQRALDSSPTAAERADLVAALAALDGKH